MGTLGSSLGDVHATVLRQHAEIRARLRGLDAGAAPAASPLATVYLRVSLFRLAVLLFCFVAESEWTGSEDLARAVSGLVVSVLDDMAEEERELTEITRLAADSPLEQMTG